MNKFRNSLIILFLIFLLGVMGCNNIIDNTQTTQTSKEKKITPSFPIKTYSSPFLEFNYPSDFELYTNDFEIPDMDTVVVYKGYIEENQDDNNMVLIMIGRNNDNTIKSSVEARDISYNKLKDLEEAGKGELKGKGIINGNIATLDAVNWDKIPMRMKIYYYINDEGKFYAAYITTYNDNWDKTKTQEIIKVFEESLKFKK